MYTLNNLNNLKEVNKGNKIVESIYELFDSSKNR